MLWLDYDNLDENGKPKLVTQSNRYSKNPPSLIERWATDEDPFGPADDPEAGPFGVKHDKTDKDE